MFETTKFNGYAGTSLGFSVNQDDIADERRRYDKSKVDECGLYVFGGAGINYRLSKSASLYTGVGLKGYKMSFNSLNVNPHGVAIMLGLRFN